MTVTVNDDDGGRGQDTFQVQVLAEPTAAIDPSPEGATATLTASLGVPVDPELSPGDLTATIQWGDGNSDTLSDFVLSGNPQTGVTASFTADHIYADNGRYAIDILVQFDQALQLDPIPIATSTLVTNVAPDVTAIGDQQTGVGQTLSLTNIATFADPGFDNPLNVGGELVETFSFAIDWGDDSTLDTGVPTIDVPGAEGTSTQGSFNGTHAYAAPGLYTVTVTVNDDDGGQGVDALQVEIDPLVFDLPTIVTNGSRPGGRPAVRPEPLPPRPVDYETTFISDDSFQRRRTALSTPGAEKKLVLRVVLPTGGEGEDVPLEVDVLSNLRDLFAKLEDDVYRIYMIRPDGTERFVLEFEVVDGEGIGTVKGEFDELLPRPPGRGVAPELPEPGGDGQDVRIERDGHGMDQRISDRTAPQQAISAAENHNSTKPHDRGTSSAAVPPLDAELAVESGDELRMQWRYGVLAVGAFSAGGVAAGLKYRAWSERVDTAMQQRRPWSGYRAWRMIRRWKRNQLTAGLPTDT